jgi:acyl transferase domain-containing protein/acyl-CoA synthetase (AMP-forming)/AMP-acid ligase II/acyl carrier protein
MSHAVIKPDTNWATFVEVLCARGLQQPSHVGYTFLVAGQAQEACITYAELDRKARAIAAHLQSMEMPRRRALLIYSPGLEYIAALFGCFYACVVAVPAYPPRPNRPPSRLEAMVVDAQAEVILSTRPAWSHVDRQRETATDLNSLPSVLTDEIDENLAAEWQDPAATPDTLALLQYTSGSTASPRGVMLSHANLLHNSELIYRSFEHSPETRGVAWLPPYHDMGLVGGVLQPLYGGFPAILMSPFAFFQRPVRWLQAVSKYRATVSGGPNFAYDLCARKITAEEKAVLDLSSWIVAFNGAEPVRAETLERFVATFESCGFRRKALYPCYGLAEATLIVSGGPKASAPEVYVAAGESLELKQVVAAEPKDKFARPLVACGSVCASQRVVIVDPESRVSCRPDQVGEIWIAGNSVAQGYWNQPDKTAQTFNARLADTDEGPFLRTGDLGFLRGEQLYVTGRLKDLIVVRGRNYYPQDIERTVEVCSPSLRPGNVAAFGIEKRDEERLAIIAEVERRFRTKDIEETAAVIRHQVAEEYDLETDAISFVEPGSIPRTSSGKIQRHVCKASFLAGGLKLVGEWKRRGESADADHVTTVVADRAPSSRVSRSQVQSWLVGLIAERAGLEARAIDSRRSLTSYGLGSLEAVEITAELEKRLGRQLSPTLAYEYPNVNALVEYLTSERRDSDLSVELKSTDHEPIAIIGMGCRFPGAKSPAAFWELLRNGVDAITKVPADRWNVGTLYDPTLASSGTMNTCWGGFLEKVDEFDSDFFGISPLEAASIDPQQRLLLEVTWEALEDAGQVMEDLAGTQVGVFMGISTNDYSRLRGDQHDDDLFWTTSNASSIAANRISYIFDFHGPSIALDTACSSSLVAVHLACRSLWNRESVLAVAGGVNLMLSPEIAVSFSQAGATSPDGRCKAFDRAANGIVRGEGAGVVVLKPLSRAQADSDPIHAVILGSAVNQDGRTNGITAPNRWAQETLLKQAYRTAGVSPDTVQYVETHGTGTFLGDPIEAKALGTVLAANRPAQQPCAIGSVKTNLGHLEAAAGIAGLIKVALSLEHGLIPPSLHFHEPNPHIDWDSLSLRVQRMLDVWQQGAMPPVAGVSAFGFGGTNAHVVLRGIPAVERERSQDSGPNQAVLLPISARNPDALKALALAYKDSIANAAFGTTESWRVICYSASVRRSHHDCRLAVLVNSTEDLEKRLDIFARGKTQRGTYAEYRRPNRRRPVVFVFSGHGSQWVSMGRQLFAQEPVFRAAVLECDQVMQKQFHCSIVEELSADETHSRVDTELEITQPAIFAVQRGLSALWQSWGITPDTVLGHSMGEVAAAHVAGALSLSDAVTVICHRSRLLQEMSQQAAVRGAMAMTKLRIEEARELVAKHDGLALAAHNSPDATVLSGEESTLHGVLRELKERRVAYRVMNAKGAGHGTQVRLLQTTLQQRLSGLRPQVAPIPISSTVTGGICAGSEFDAHYWGKNIAEPVLFAEAIQGLLHDGFDLFLEVSPDSILGSSILQCLRHGNRQGTVLPSMLRDRDERSTMLSSLGAFYAMGHDVQWDKVYGRVGRCVALPSYPWQRKRCWLAPQAKRSHTGKIGAGGHQLLGWHMPAAEPAGNHYWEGEIDGQGVRFINDHRIDGVALVPGAAYMEMAAAAAASALGEGPRTLTEVEFRRALFLDSGKMPLIQVVLSRNEDETHSFHVYSWQEKTERDLDSAILHAKAKVCRNSDSIDDGPRNYDLQQLRQRLVDGIDIKDFYATLRRAGVEYGTLFQGIEQLWRHGNEALGRIHFPRGIEGDIQSYRFHPAILDACLQVLAATVPRETGKTHCYLPVSATQVRFYRSPSEPLWSYACRQSDVEEITGVFEGDVQIFDDDGGLVAEIRGFRVQDLQRSRRGGIDDSICEPRWERNEPVSATLATPAQPREGNWLVFVDRQGVAKRLAALLTEAGEPCIEISRGCVYQQRDPLHFEICPEQPEHMKRLVGEAIGSGRPCAGILHLWSLDAPPSEQLTLDALRSALFFGCNSVLRLTRELVRAKEASGQPRLWLITQGAQQVGAQAASVSVAQSSLWGMGRTIAQEHPALWGGLVDLDPQASAEDAAHTLHVHISNPDREDQIAFRQGQRYVARLFPNPSLPQAATVRLRVDATYLITGGLGELGLVVARWMVEHGARRLILLGRTPLPPRVGWGQAEPGSRLACQINCIRALEAQGATVHLAAVDVANEDQLSSLLRQYDREGWPPIRGVVHMAGVVHGQILAEMTTEDLLADFLPKAAGGWALHRLFQNVDLDFFILFSSGASLLGSPFLGSYAASNAFLDSLAHHRNSLHVPALSINWGFWSEAGMAARQIREHNKTFAPRGMRSFTNAQGMEVLGRLLNQKSPQLAAMPFDWKEWCQYHPIAAQAPMLSYFASRQTAPVRKVMDSSNGDGGLTRNVLINAEPAQRPQIMQSYVTQYLSRVMGVSPSELDADESLIDLGVDSLMAVELRNRIESELGVTIPMIKLLQGPSIARISALLLEAMEAEPAPPSLLPSVPTAEASNDGADKRDSEVESSVEAAETLLANIDQLSDQDVATLLESMHAVDHQGES